MTLLIAWCQLRMLHVAAARNLIRGMMMLVELLVADVVVQNAEQFDARSLLMKLALN